VGKGVSLKKGEKGELSALLERKSNREKGRSIAGLEKIRNPPIKKKGGRIRVFTIEKQRRDTWEGPNEFPI